jgi:hypothetical protein
METFPSQVNASPVAPVQGKHRRWMGVVLLVVAVLMVAGLGFWYWQSSRATSVVSAPAGKIAPGFPLELIGEPGAYIAQSYSVSASGISQPTVTYISNKNLKDNIAAFRALLLGAGWQIAQEASDTLPVTAIYAKKGTAVLNVSFDARKMPLRVTEAYVGSL